MAYYENTQTKKTEIRQLSESNRSLGDMNVANLTRCSASTNNNYTASQGNRKVFVVPAGNIDQVLMLDSKSPTEEKFYSFTLRNRMLSGDTIVKVDVRPAGDSDVTSDQLIIFANRQDFSVRLKGGKINQNIGLLFQVTTQKGEMLDFVCTLPVRAQGVLAKEGNVVVVMGGPAVGKGVGIQAISTKDGQFLFQMTDGTTQTVALDAGKSLPVPADFTVNGSLYIAPDAYITGTKAMPEGLSLNGNLVLTDGSVAYQNTYNNGGVLCAV